MTYNIINTGSDGNCTIIDDVIAVDMGITYKKVSPYATKLQLVLLTHIHGDHFHQTTIKRLAKERPGLRFGCCAWLVEDLLACGVDRRNIDVYEIGKAYKYGALVVSPIKLTHDVPNCGYKIHINNEKLIYATDTNTLDGIIAKNYDYYLVEGNYENAEELHERAYCETYEKRVLATHLSKEYTTKWLLENMGENSQYKFMHEHKER